MWGIEVMCTPYIEADIYCADERHETEKTARCRLEDRQGQGFSQAQRRGSDVDGVQALRVGSSRSHVAQIEPDDSSGTIDLIPLEQIALHRFGDIVPQLLG